jgi:homoserine dehydrogenase
VAPADGVGVGLIGLGTVGAGVAQVLRENAAVVSARLGFPLRLVRAADLDASRAKDAELAGARFDGDADALIDDPAVAIVVELIGGTGAARRLILRAIERRKHVVTANKALLAEHGKEIFDAAAKAGVDVAFEASVGGGIPILRSMREGLAANRIERVCGIVNGTTNYMLSEMEATGEPFAAVLARAQDLGYAEKGDPTLDVDGIDAAHKLTLLAAMAFGADLTHRDVPTEGIRELAPVDFAAAREFGYRIKLLGIAKRREGPGGEERIEVRVHPTMIPRASLLANVDGAMNAIAVHGNAVGPTLFYGAGAGRLPSASAVVADLMEIARAIRQGTPGGRVAPLSYLPGALRPRPLVPLAELHGRVYLCFSVEDRPGVLGEIATALGAHEIGIESLLQKRAEEGAGRVPVVVLTHPAPEGAVRRALDRIDALPRVAAPTRLIRIEEDL